MKIITEFEDITPAGSRPTLMSVRWNCLTCGDWRSMNIPLQGVIVSGDVLELKTVLCSCGETYQVKIPHPSDIGIDA